MDVECGRCRLIYEYDEDDLGDLSHRWLYLGHVFVCPGCQSPADKMRGESVARAARLELARRALRRRGLDV